MKTRNIMNGHMGNGVVCFDTLHEKHGDYEKVAHILADRTIEYYVELSTSDILKIEEIAFFDDRNISQTQDAKVFLTRAPKMFDKTMYKICREIYNSGIVYTAMTVDGEEITAGHDTYKQAVTALLSEINTLTA